MIKFFALIRPDSPVIPAKAGIPCSGIPSFGKQWIHALAGMTANNLIIK
jgi:hypothetical protein